MNLLEQLNNHIESMTLGEKLFASLQVTLLGMFIVFIALILLYFFVVAMNLVLVRPVKAKEKEKTPAEKLVKEPAIEEVVEAVVEETIDDTELVAVITAAIAASLETSTHNIIVKNIVRLPDSTPAWGKLGRMQQLNM
ncbi:OadG family protein [Alkaliphilus serpentinus]|uniref:Sodium pump decarboxylase subunit gamma n=1 Tax=Alkaliphilus serpentinus TaxID=1482731 RepID=A0A833HRQ1_9FIRM|nr:OadG family protein [Alkaliphilus serpentinus]KAB3533796.1 sodium pump decarboxylase subunit gamma [Alkaliphilus serpentinus]